MKERADIYDKVNQCETFGELAQVIRSLADEDGMIQGRVKKFDAEKMAKHCEGFKLLYEVGAPNALTREFGIRQQAMYINYYTK
jgi:hypothetical protein